MRSAIIFFTLVTAAVAEAPYHLPRPAFHAPAFSYSQPAHQPPPPAILPHLNPLPQLPHQHIPLQSFNPQPAPQLSNVQSGYNYPQPSQIQFQPQIHTQQQLTSIPQVSYYSPPQPQQIPVSYLRPQQIFQQPSLSYGQPQALPAISVPQPRPTLIRPLPALSLPQQPSPIALFQQQQFSSGLGYSYQQPQIPISTIPQLPLQSQLGSYPSTSISSYQSDFNQYNSPEQSQTHREALDSTVVSRVQNIIKETEHSAARDAGFLSLVSGVSLENAKPSVEITSFVQNSALPASVDSSSFSSSSASQSSSAASSDTSANYGLPSLSSSSQSSSTGSSLSFLPNTQPAASYGVPN